MLPEIYRKFFGLFILAVATVAVCCTGCFVLANADLEGEQAFKTAVQADNELNSVYKQILEKYKDDKLFISKLEKAQSNWLKFRDAHLESVYPGKNKTFYYGSAYPVCANRIMTELTQQRIKQLKLWLNGIQEGDVCAGSRKWE